LSAFVIPFADVTPSARSAPIVAARLAARLSAFAKGGASSLSAILAQMSSAVRVAETLDLGMFLLPHHRNARFRGGERGLGPGRYEGNGVRGRISLDNLVFCGHWAAFAARLKAASSRQVPQKQTT
jgi:hypothetical protein